MIKIVAIANISYHDHLSLYIAIYAMHVNKISYHHVTNVCSMYCLNVTEM